MKNKTPYPPDAPWPCMRGDIHNTGRSPLARAARKTYKSSAPDDVQYFQTGNGVFSTPVIDGKGIIYVGSADHNFYAFDPEIGEEKWRVETGEIIDSAACLGKDGALYIPSGDAKIHAYRVSSPGGAPQRLWQFDVLKERDPKLFSLSTSYWWEANVVLGPDGALYSGNDDFYFYCIERDGKMRWAFRTGFLIWAAAAFSKSGIVYIPSFDMNLYALRPENGNVIWKTNLHNTIASSPAVGADGTVYQGCMDGRLYALDGETGRVKWTVATGGHIYASAAISEDGIIYIGSTDGFLRAVDGVNGNLKWSFFTGDAIRSSASLGTDPEDEKSCLIYFGGGDGLMYALDPQGRKRWSYDTCAGAPKTDYPNINASPALGADGLAVARANGDVIWIPYDYYLREDAVGIERDPSGYNVERAAWHYVTPGGLLRRDHPEKITANCAQAISFRFLAPYGLPDGILAQIDQSGLRIQTSPPSRLRVEPQSDGATINLIPDEMLEPGADYEIRVSAPYSVGDKLFPTVEGIFTISIPSPVINKSPLLEEGASFCVSHMSIPQPAIVPSLDQIGIASLTIPFSIVESDRESETFVAWGVQNFGVTESGDTVGVPLKRSLIYAFVGKCNGDHFLMQANNCFFEITAFPVPLDSFRLSGRMGVDGSVEEGASLVAEYKVPRFLSETLPRLMTGSWRGIYKTMAWLIGEMKRGKLRFLDASKTILPAIVEMASRRVWHKWRLFNQAGDFIGIGTFRMRVTPETQRASHSQSAIKHVEINYRPRSRQVVAEYEIADAHECRNKVFGILLIDSSGNPAPINYNIHTRTTISGCVQRTILSIPLGFRIEKGKTRTVLMCDLDALCKTTL